MATKRITDAALIAAAPANERWIPLNQDGAVLYDRENGSAGFANVTPQGRAKFRRMYRGMACRARAANVDLQTLAAADDYERNPPR